MEILELDFAVYKLLSPILLPLLGLINVLKCYF